MIWTHLWIVLLAIFAGTRLKGIGLGLMGGLGLVVLTFGFGLQPTDPPFNVLLIITCVGMAAASLEAAGGLAYLTSLAEASLRRYPNSITLLAPILTYWLCFFVGTSHLVYSILPIVAEVARETGVRPSRPLTMTVVAAQQAAMASPISAPVTVAISLLSTQGVELLDVLKILIGATFGGVLIAALVTSQLGKALQDDPTCTNITPDNGFHNQQSIALPAAGVTAKRAVLLFFLGIFFVISLGIFKDLRPSWHIGGTPQLLNMATAIEVVMLAIGALIVLLCGVKTATIVQGRVFSAIVQAMISIMGIAWLGDTFINAHKSTILAAVQAHILMAPWQFSFIMFAMAIIFVSQTATIRALLPLGFLLGIPTSVLVASLPAANALLVIPNYPMVLAAINLDRTGSTKIGKYILNHSFLIPGLVATWSAVAIAFMLTKLL